MSGRGSLVYQMQETLKTVFRPGHSRHEDKKNGRCEIIRGIQTMRANMADVAQFARYVRIRWPNTNSIDQITPAMAQAFIAELRVRERSGGRIGRVISSIRKMDLACRKAGIFPVDSPSLMPAEIKGFHSDYRTTAYSAVQIRSLLGYIEKKDPEVVRLLATMWVTGLRITEAVYLRSDNIDLENKLLDLSDNSNRTKGGRPRRVVVEPEYASFLGEIALLGDANNGKHIFRGRGSLPDRARVMVREACAQLTIPCLGTHGFRKAFAVRQFLLARETSPENKGRCIQFVSQQLGHNRMEITKQSYVGGR
jgi:integrase